MKISSSQILKVGHSVVA